MHSYTENSYRRFSPWWWKHWFDYRNYWRQLKVYYQRATRGWADCDVWGLDGYICEVLVPALEHLRKTKHGFPMPPDAVFDPDTGNATDEEYARWREIWNTRLDEMIAGFRAAEALINLGDWPDEFFVDNEFNQTAWDTWQKEKEQVRQTGFAAFTKYFLHLWD